MYRASTCPSSGGQIVLSHHLVSSLSVTVVQYAGWEQSLLSSGILYSRLQRVRKWCFCVPLAAVPSGYRLQGTGWQSVPYPENVGPSRGEIRDPRRNTHNRFVPSDLVPFYSGKGWNNYRAPSIVEVKKPFQVNLCDNIKTHFTLSNVTMAVLHYFKNFMHFINVNNTWVISVKFIYSIMLWHWLWFHGNKTLLSYIYDR
jgi:hypothetical protein